MFNHFFENFLGRWCIMYKFILKMIKLKNKLITYRYETIDTPEKLIDIQKVR